MKRLLYLIILLALAVGISAQVPKVGTAGAQFLKIGVGSRYLGLGEASVATANDVYSTYWNPAGLAEIENADLSFTNVDWILDVNLNYAAFARQFENVGAFGVFVSVLSMGDQEITTFEDQEGTGTYFSANSWSVGVSYARYLTTQFAFGGTFKMLGERIHNEKSSGFAFDFGTLFHTGFRSLRLGMSISNMGPEMQFDGPDLDVGYDDQSGQGNNTPVGARLKTTPYDLPLVFRVGLAYDFQFGENSVLTLASEVKHPNDNQQQGALGAEFAFSEKFFARAGYKINYEEEGLAFGAGLDYPISNNTNIVIDYAWQDFGRLESTQRFSVGFSF